MINKIFPWWSKIALKIVMSRIPVGYRLWRYFGLFKHGNMESSSYNIRIFNQHVLNADLNEKLHGKVALELGPGDSIATAILALCFDAKALLIDLKDHFSGLLNNLRFSKNTWESNLFANSGFYTNRIRFCKMIDIFKALYGGVIVSKEYRWNALPLDRNLLDLEYVNLSDQDLLVSAFDVILTK